MYLPIYGFVVAALKDIQKRLCNVSMQWDFGVVR